MIFSSKDIEIVRLFPSIEEETFTVECSEFEHNFEYPLGDDFFKIYHGKDYFEFFKRLGEPKFYGAFLAGRLVAMGGAVLREVKPFSNSNKKIKTWYLCDVKVHPDFRGRKLTSKIFQRNLLWNYFRCQRGYTISMNPAGRKNPVVRLVRQMSFLPFSHYDDLYIYQLKEQEFKSSQKKLIEILGEFSIKNNSGVKDIILKSSGSALNLNHVVPGLKGNIDIQEGTFMFCLPSKNLKNKLLNESGISHNATASIIGHRMNSDWNFITSADI